MNGLTFCFFGLVYANVVRTKTIMHPNHEMSAQNIWEHGDRQTRQDIEFLLCFPYRPLFEQVRMYPLGYKPRFLNATKL